MALWISPYAIHADEAKNSRSPVGTHSGILIKVEEAGATGYGDCHPLPSLGDFNYEEQLERLREGQPTTLMCRSIELAKKDARTRAKGESLSPETEFMNHRLLSYLNLLVEGSQVEASVPIKLKLGISISDEIYQINRFCESFKNPLRLDFNATLNRQSYEEFVDALRPAAREQIEFVEEPMPYEPSSWEQVSGLLPLAIDNELFRLQPTEEQEELPFDYMLIKPACRDPEPLVKLCEESKIRFLFTHYMDHPVGVRHAVAEAANYFDHPLCSPYHGLAPKPWQLRALNSAFTEACFDRWSGAGVGWDSLLESVSWTPL